MAHSHLGCQSPRDYFTEQLLTILVCGALGFVGVDEPHVRFMNQGGGLQGLAGLLLRQALGGEPPQFVVHQGEQLIGRSLVAVFDRREDARHVVHRPAREGGRVFVGQCNTRCTNRSPPKLTVLHVRR